LVDCLEFDQWPDYTPQKSQILQLFY